MTATKPGADKNLKSNSENRRASKPLMEKRRRARINQSLSILKSLIVDSTRVEGQKHSKLEKADILELTVTHLQSLKKSDEQKFIEGFEECSREAVKFLEKTKINRNTIDKLMGHLKTTQQSSSEESGESNSDEGLCQEDSVSSNASTCPSIQFPVESKFDISNFNSVSSVSSSACPSPNDSNNNSLSEVGGIQVIRRLDLASGQVVFIVPAANASNSAPTSSANSSSTISNSMAMETNCSAINLTKTSSGSPINHTNVDSPEEFSDSEPLDFSKPLDLCKNSQHRLMPDDGVWRPW